METEELKQKLHALVQQYGLTAVEEALYQPETDEPLLNPSHKKFTAFPIEYPTLWELYKKQIACIWMAEEIDFSGDYDDFQTLKPDEKFFIESILAFFAASDGIVNFNLGQRFLREVQVTEAQFAYGFQMMMENIHSHVYSLMLENLVKNPERRQHLFNAIQTVPSVKSMADWSFKWISSSESFAHRVVAFALVEGVFFSGAFAAIFWVKKNLNRSGQATKSHLFLNGLVSSNKLIARDEGLHCLFACELYRTLKHKLDVDSINKIVDEAVTVSKQFMTDALPVRLIGMNSEMMNDYLEYIADRLLVMLGYAKVYNKSNPFKFMEEIGLDDKANFFEVRPTEYQNSHVMNKTISRKLVLSDNF